MRLLDACFGMSAALLLSACVTSTVQTETLQSPPAEYTVAVVGDVTATEELWTTYALWTQMGLSDALVESGAFTQVLEEEIASVPPGALIITGRIVEVDRGSGAARFIIGFGLGRSHITSDLVLSEAGGTQVGRFSVRRAYSGGIGIGGAGLIQLEDLARLVGEQAADTIVEWVMTGNLQSSE